METKTPYSPCIKTADPELVAERGRALYKVMQDLLEKADDLSNNWDRPYRNWRTSVQFHADVKLRQSSHFVPSQLNGCRYEADIDEIRKLAEESLNGVKRYGRTNRRLVAERRKMVIEALTKRFSNMQTLDGMWEAWLDWERSYLTNDWIKGCAHTSRKWWMENVHPKIARGERTGYTAIDECYNNVAQKYGILKEWIENDERFLTVFEYVNHKTVGFYGRSGGQFGFDLTIHIGQLAGALYDDIVMWLEENEPYEELDHDEVEGMVKDYTNLKNLSDNAKLVCQTIEGMASGLNFREEIKYRMEEALEEIEADLFGGRKGAL